MDDVAASIRAVAEARTQGIAIPATRAQELTAASGGRGIGPVSAGRAGVQPRAVRARAERGPASTSDGRPVGSCRRSIPRCARTHGVWVAWGSGSADRGDGGCPGPTRWCHRRLAAIPYVSPGMARRSRGGRLLPRLRQQRRSGRSATCLIHHLAVPRRGMGAISERSTTGSPRRPDEEMTRLEHAGRGEPIVWIHDYHLALVAAALRHAAARRFSFIRFWHIPFPPHRDTAPAAVRRRGVAVARHVGKRSAWSSTPSGTRSISSRVHRSCSRATPRIAIRWPFTTAAAQRRLEPIRSASTSTGSRHWRHRKPRPLGPRRSDANTRRVGANSASAWTGSITPRGSPSGCVRSTCCGTMARVSRSSHGAHRGRAVADRACYRIRRSSGRFWSGGRAQRPIRHAGLDADRVRERGRACGRAGGHLPRSRSVLDLIDSGRHEPRGQGVHRLPGRSSAACSS